LTIQFQTFLWQFRCYVDEKKHSDVREFIDSLPTKTKARLKRSLEILTGLDIQEWHKPNPASFINNHIYVIRFKDTNRQQWRIYGFHDKDKKTFVFTYYGTEKDGKYKPSVDECVSESTNRMEQCTNNWDARTEHCIPSADAKLNITTHLPKT